MAKRIRSPNYPAISLPDALERLNQLWNSIQARPASRELIANGIGYSKLHGASIAAISALQKYGLLERDKDKLKISERGKVCLKPLSEKERLVAIREAAAAPALFGELDEQFPGGRQNDEMLRNYLSRKGFSQVALPNVLRSYRETLEFLAQASENGAEEHDDLGRSRSATRPPSQLRGGATTHSTQSVATASPGNFLVSMTKEFLVDISASKLDRTGVDRLVKWLDANKQLVPDPGQQEEEDPSNLLNTDS